MCQRKIIRASNPPSETIVPLMNGCDCPMIKEFHHVDTKLIESVPVGSLRKPRKVYQLPNHCFDIHTTIPIENVPDHHVVFRNCVCSHPSGVCMILPPLLYEPDDHMNDDENDDEFRPGGNMGIRPRI